MDEAGCDVKVTRLRSVLSLDSLMIAIVRDGDVIRISVFQCHQLLKLLPDTSFRSSHFLANPIERST